MTPSYLDAVSAGDSPRPRVVGFAGSTGMTHEASTPQSRPPRKTTAMSSACAGSWNPVTVYSPGRRLPHGAANRTRSPGSKKPYENVFENVFDLYSTGPPRS